MSREFLIPSVTATIETQHGQFVTESFPIGGFETIVLHTRDIPGTDDDVLCRIQSECVSHAFFDRSCDCADQISAALKQIQESGTGVLIYLRQEGMGLGIAGKLTRDNRDWRNYFVAVEILKHYGIRSVRLISLNKAKISALRDSGIDVRSYFWHEGKTILIGDRLKRTVEQVRLNQAQRPIEKGELPRVLIIGDLNVDRISIIREPSIGGTAFHAAVAIQKMSGFLPILFGKVGRDENGSFIRSAIQTSGLHCLIGLHESKATGLVEVTPTGDPLVAFQCIWDKRNNANDYDADNLSQAMELAAIGPSDYIFVASFLFVQKLFNKQEVNRVLRIASDTNAKIILDLVRKSLARDTIYDCGLDRVDQALLSTFIEEVRIHAVVGEMGTFNSLGLVSGKSVPDQEVFAELAQFFKAKWVICRYVEGGEVHQRVACISEGKVVVVTDQNAGVHVSGADVRIGVAGEMFASALAAMDRYERMN